jgi:N-acetylglucosamine-6-phosphate deacetylase
MSEDNILTPRGWMRGRLVHAHGKVTAIDGAPCDPADNDLPYLLPGFIDLHVHGGGGKDIMEGASAFETITRTHVRFGTTSLLATTMTAPVDEISSVLGQLGTFCAQRPPAAPGCSACTWKAPTSIRENSAHNPTSPTPH